MKKDVIYIDIEDDITSIIEKVKAAKADIVALVPPKRIGTLQSVVNLKLLQRAAGTAKKRVVLITSDTALSTLAAGVSIPIAKNLQSKPEIPEIAALDVDDEDIINGDELPIGELAGTAPIAASEEPKTTPATTPKTPVTAAPLAASAAAKAPKKGSRVPNFESFRKRLFLLVGGGVLLLAFLIWAIFFAGHATIAITAKTNIVNIAKTLQLNPSATLDVDQNVIPATVQQTKKTTSVDFPATGKKTIGDKASGTVHVRNCDSSQAFTIDAGTTFTASSGQTYSNSAAVNVPGFTGSASACRTTGAGAGKADAAVVATDIGTGFNIPATSYSIAGISGDVYANGDAMTGGTQQTVTVVSQDDINKAKDQLKAQDANSVKSDLQKQFDADSIIISESFVASPGDPTSTPALDQQATTAKLTAETTYTLVGVKRVDLKAIYDAYLKGQIAGDPTQKVYESGDNATQFSQFSAGENNTFSVKASAVAQIGPNIDSAALAKQVAGKRSGEIQQQVEAVQGVEDVQTTLSPFWVTKAPSNPNRITIKFVLQHDSQ